jgi:carboxyl-terminal processing protease
MNERQARRMEAQKKAGKWAGRRVNLLIIVLLLTALTSCARPSAVATPAGFMAVPITDKNKDGWPDGWDPFRQTKANYEVRIDEFDGGPGILMQSTSLDSDNFGAIYRELSPLPDYRGQRVRFSADLKSADVTGRAVLWFRVDGLGGKILAFDNMLSNPVIGTNEWRRYEIVFDVPQNSVQGAVYGFMLMGTGQAWMRNPQIDIVDQTVPVIDQYVYAPKALNLNFEAVQNNQLDGWFITSSHAWDYTIGADTSSYEGMYSGAVRSDKAVAYAWGGVWQRIDAEPYRGQKVRLSAYMKTAGVSEKVTMSMNMIGQPRPTYSTVENQGTTDWQQYEIVLTVDRRTTNILLDFTLQGQGQLWIDDVRLETVSTDEAENAEVDKALQQEVFVELWTAVNDNYVYSNFNGLDWAAMKDIYLAKIEGGLTDDAFWQAMKELIALLDDQHSSFMTPAEALARQALMFEEPGYAGIGIYAAPLPAKGYGVVLYAFPGSPAANSGIKAHDRLLVVDGQAFCCDEKGSLRSNLMLGEAGSEVTIAVQTPGQERREIVVRREQIKGEVQIEARRLAGDIGYMMIPTLQNLAVGERTEAAWRELNREKPLKGLILDLRPNQGGLDEPLHDVLSLFADGRLGEFHSQAGSRPLTVTGRDLLRSQSIPLVILVGPATNSYGEVLAGALQESGRATLIGQPTNANVERLQLYLFSDGSQAWLAVENFVPPSGADWEQTGVIPDIEVRQGWDDFTTDAEDQAVQEALARLLSRNKTK